MPEVKKVILVFEDDTTEESEKFFGEFHIDKEKDRLIGSKMTLGEMFFSIRKMEYAVNREFENQMKEVK